ncbi:MAG TPA: (d)CMP kinase [Syntrophomonas sp.]|nr:(d)CMP kinase [Syntrophomonas sp.]HRW11721.1 (d)CMP kinase [Syntrophomonas sp.]
MQIAIDGPAGAGKSTAARLIAEKLGYIYIDTGAMYRALTWKALVKKIDLQDEEKLRELAGRTDIRFVKEAEQQQVFCDGVDVSEAIRSPQINANVSVVAAQPRVRNVMVKKQQDMAQMNDVVMDGRDIGEQVLPQADIKFYVTASIEERTRRRLLELEKQGFIQDETSVRRQIEERDRMDRERAMGALKILDDAFVIDTSHLDIEVVLDRMLAIIGEKQDALQ